MGLMREARRAEMYPARKATALRSKIIPAKVAGSVGSVPNRSEAIPRATANDATVPNCNPEERESQGFGDDTRLDARRSRARAIRMPIS